MLWLLVSFLFFKYFVAFFCFYFVAGNDKADVGTQHLLQLLHPALHLVETEMMKIGVETVTNNIAQHMKNIIMKLRNEINLVETVLVCYVIDKDGS